MWWVIHMCRGFDPLFSLWQDRARSFWGIFSHPPTPKRSFVVLKLPILTEFDLLGPKFHFSLDLFGSNFQRPAPSFFGPSTPPGVIAYRESNNWCSFLFFLQHTGKAQMWCCCNMVNFLLSTHNRHPRVSIVTPKSDLCFKLVTRLWYSISCYIEPCYKSTRLLKFTNVHPFSHFYTVLSPKILHFLILTYIYNIHITK